MAAMLLYMRGSLQEQGAYQAAPGGNTTFSFGAAPPGRTGGTDESHGRDSKHYMMPPV
jgi:hypothetical protein